jgi:hypothetical protein
MPVKLLSDQSNREPVVLWAPGSRVSSSPLLLRPPADLEEWIDLGESVDLVEPADNGESADIVEPTEPTDLGESTPAAASFALPLLCLLCVQRLRSDARNESLPPPEVLRLESEDAGQLLPPSLSAVPTHPSRRDKPTGFLKTGSPSNGHCQPRPWLGLAPASHRSRPPHKGPMTTKPLFWTLDLGRRQ